MTDLSISKNSALNAIYRMKKKGELISPLKGLYVIVPPEHMVHGSIPADELVPIIMKHLNVPKQGLERSLALRRRYGIV